MEPAPKTGMSLTRQQALELLGPALLLVFRAFSRPVTSLWRDWVALLAVYWAATILSAGKKAWTPITVAFMAFLMILYLSGQLPQTRWALDAALW